MCVCGHGCVCVWVGGGGGALEVSQDTTHGCIVYCELKHAVKVYWIDSRVMLKFVV